MAFAIPLIDTALAIIRRFLHNKPIFSADADTSTIGCWIVDTDPARSWCSYMPAARSGLSAPSA